MNAQWWVCPRPSTMLLGPAGVPLSPTPSDPPKILFNTIRLLSSWEFHHFIILCRTKWIHSFNFNHIPRIPEVRSGWTKKGCFIWEWIDWLAWIPPTNMYNISPLCNLMSPCLLLIHAYNPYFLLVFPSTNLQKLFKHALCPIFLYVNPTKMSLKHLNNRWEMLYVCHFGFNPTTMVSKHMKNRWNPMKNHEPPLPPGRADDRSDLWLRHGLYRSDEGGQLGLCGGKGQCHWGGNESLSSATRIGWFIVV